MLYLKLWQQTFCHDKRRVDVWKTSETKHQKTANRTETISKTCTTRDGLVPLSLTGSLLEQGSLFPCFALNYQAALKRKNVGNCEGTQHWKRPQSIRRVKATPWGNRACGGEAGAKVSHLKLNVSANSNSISTQYPPNTWEPFTIVDVMKGFSWNKEDHWMDWTCCLQNVLMWIEYKFEMLRSFGEAWATTFEATHIKGCSCHSSAGLRDLRRSSFVGKIMCMTRIDVKLSLQWVHTTIVTASSSCPWKDTSGWSGMAGWTGSEQVFTAILASAHTEHSRNHKRKSAHSLLCVWNRSHADDASLWTFGASLSTWKAVKFLLFHSLLWTKSLRWFNEMTSASKYPKGSDFVVYPRLDF